MERVVLRIMPKVNSTSYQELMLLLEEEDDESLEEEELSVSLLLSESPSSLLELEEVLDVSDSLLLPRMAYMAPATTPREPDLAMFSDGHF